MHVLSSIPQPTSRCFPQATRCSAKQARIVTCAVASANTERSTGLADTTGLDMGLPVYLQEPDLASESTDLAELQQAAGPLLEEHCAATPQELEALLASSELLYEQQLWNQIRTEAEEEAAKEPFLSSFLYSSVLSHGSLCASLAFILANRLASPTLQATELLHVFNDVLENDDVLREAVVADLLAVKERDPATLNHVVVLVFSKGFQAIQAHRLAHHLWQRGNRVFALALQSRVSEAFAVDIHPGARLGKGLLMDHATGCVIGETVVVGDHVSIMQNVTLGGTGKDSGDRHPKVQDNVLIGAGATILGNIVVGKYAQVGAGSLVLKPVPSRTVVSGSPAKEVGVVTWNPAAKMHHVLKIIRRPGALRQVRCKNNKARSTGVAADMFLAEPADLDSAEPETEEDTDTDGGIDGEIDGELEERTLIPDTSTSGKQVDDSEWLEWEI